VVLNSGKKGPSGGNSNFGSGFLPTVYQGVPFRGSGDPVLYLSNPAGIDGLASVEECRFIKRWRVRYDGGAEFVVPGASF